MIVTRSLSVTTTRQAIAPPVEDSEYGYTVWLYAEFHGSSNGVAFGGADVTYANGVHIYKGEKFGPVWVPVGDAIHVITESETPLELRALLIGT